MLDTAEITPVETIAVPSCRFHVKVQDGAHSVIDARSLHTPVSCESYNAARDLRDRLNCQLSA